MPRTKTSMFCLLELEAVNPNSRYWKLSVDLENPVQEVLLNSEVHQGLYEALLGEKSLPDSMSEKDKKETLEKAHSAIILNLGDKVMRKVAKKDTTAGATVTSKKVLDFVVKHIIFWFRLPQKIISDSGKQVDSQLFTDFCIEQGIIISFSAVARPQDNGQVKAVNKTLKDFLKKWHKKAKGNWPEVLWSY
uniref:Integrase catalytic domain-containing protein n=1 Tax=Cannabis sativa TaxID=3483 RepID=A0A803NU46_CANSA